MKEEYFNIPIACPICGGSGWVWIHTQASEKCTNCNGTGIIYARMRVDGGQATDYSYQEA